MFLETSLDPSLELEVGMASLEAQRHMIRGLEASTDTGSVSKKKEGTGYLPAMPAINSLLLRNKQRRVIELGSEGKAYN